MARQLVPIGKLVVGDYFIHNNGLFSSAGVVLGQNPITHTTEVTFTAPNWMVGHVTRLSALTPVSVNWPQERIKPVAEVPSIDGLFLGTCP